MNEIIECTEMLDTIPAPPEPGKRSMWADGQVRSFTGGVHVVVRVNGNERIVFRRYEHGKEVAVSP